MLSVDLNCDMGEAFGPWPMGRDAELIRFISSANIACGFHAGDASTMRRTIDLAIEHNVAVGAHPGYPDLQGFGRRPIQMSPVELADQVLYQISAMKGMCEAAGTRLRHVKPHGAMYNQAAADRSLADAIISAVKRLDPELIVYGLAGSKLIEAADQAGLRSASEVFADRTYQNDGSLTSRSMGNALISDPLEAAAQAIGMVENGSVGATDGTAVAVKADTICIHGDGPHAVAFAKAIRRELDTRSITVRPPA